MRLWCLSFRYCVLCGICWTSVLSSTECHEIIPRVSSLAEFKAVPAQNSYYTLSDSIWDQVSNVNVELWC